MNTFNDFQITARLTADAKITKFQNTSVAHGVKTKKFQISIV